MHLPNLNTRSPGYTAKVWAFVNSHFAGKLRSNNQYEQCSTLLNWWGKLGITQELFEYFGARCEFMNQRLSTDNVISLMYMARRGSGAPLPSPCAWARR
eukprot:6605497-Pyramimonas_sp.AAC.1